MAAFLAVKERDQESLACVGIFVLSTLYIVIFYEKVNDHGEFEEQIEARNAKLTDAELEIDINKWR